ncbi:MAG: tetratricopeptide repeat protein [Acidobacteriota bacterium]
MSLSDLRPLGLALILVAALAPAVAQAQDAAAARLFQEAERLSRSGDPAAALAEYRLLVQQFPRDSLAAKALLATARLHRILGDDRSATLTVDRLLDAYPRTPEAASAFVIQGQIAAAQARSPGDLEAALTSFRRVPLLFGVDAFPTLEARAQALVRHGEISLLIGRRDAALADFTAVSEDEPPGPHAWRGRRLLGRTLLETGEVTPALETLQRLADDADADAGEKDAARRLISLAHRLFVRPEGGQAPWRRSERFAPNGLQLDEVVGVAAADDNSLLIVDEGAEKVIRITPDHSRWETVALRDGGRPGFTDDVAHVVTEKQLVLPFDGRRVSFLEPKAGRENPLNRMRGAARGPFGDWFVLARGFRGLISYQTPRKGQELLSSLRPDLTDVEVDALGRVYVLDRKDSRILRLAVDRRSHQTVVTGDWRRPEALALDALGHLYVLDTGAKQIHVYHPDGRRKSVLGPTLPMGLELKKPRDLAVDGSGRIFVADADQPFLVSLQ